MLIDLSHDCDKNRPTIEKWIAFKSTIFAGVKSRARGVLQSAIFFRAAIQMQRIIRI